jgi:flagellar hook-associated protein 1 FlgK
MSLFGSIQMGGNTLRAMQIGLQVVGNNIANANTPGYIRQEAVYVPAPVQKVGNLILGTGVLVDGIVQKLDRFIQERLVGARGDRAGAEVQEKIYRDIESLLNEISDDEDLSNSLTTFFNAIDEVANAPDSVAARSAAVGAGDLLTKNFGSLHSKVFDIREELDKRVISVADEVNSLAEEIRLLNVQIASTEGGDASSSAAGGLRVNRNTAVDKLSELVGIHIEEQPSGGLAVALGGEFLVFEGQRREVEIGTTLTDGVAASIVQFADTHSALQLSSGELQGLYTARNEVVQGLLDGLDEVAGTLAFEFNKLYSQGQGLVGFSSLTSQETVSDSEAALDAAGLPFTPVSGTFDVLIKNKDSNLPRTYTIHVRLNGLDDDTSLDNLAEQLNAIDGLAATISPSGALQLSGDSSDIEFAFDDDTSGALAALGLNTFFTGSTAGSIGVNSELQGIKNTGKFSASLGGIGGGSENALRLAAFLDTPLEAAGNASLADIYDQLINSITQGSSIAQSVAEGFRVFEGTLDGQQQAISGVSIDEEAVKMITLQRIYQASARYIQAISELMDVLVNL